MLESVISGTISGVVTALLLSFAALIWQIARTEKFVINLVLPPKLVEFPIGILHVRNDDGQILNRVHWLHSLRLHPLRAYKPTVSSLGKPTEPRIINPREAKRMMRTAAFRHPRRIGFQYKCFIDLPDKLAADSARSELTSWGFPENTPGQGRTHRVWFLVPDEARTIDAAGISNNCHYPE